MIYSYKDKDPQIHSSCFIAPSADVIGDVTIGEGSSIWYQCVLRGDVNSISIGKNTNIQDGTVIHNAKKYAANIGDNVTVGHNCIIHACTIGNTSLIGMGATVLDGAEIGNYCIVGANTLVTGNKKFPDGVLIMGSPGKVIRELTEAERKRLEDSAEHYVVYAEEHKN